MERLSTIRFSRKTCPEDIGQHCDRGPAKDNVMPKFKTFKKFTESPLYIFYREAGITFAVYSDLFMYNRQHLFYYFIDRIMCRIYYDRILSNF